MQQDLLNLSFNKGLNRQRLEVAKAQYEENVATFQQTVLNAGREVSDAMYSYQAVANKTNTRTLQLDAWKRASDNTRELLKNGYATYTDVLTSEQGLLLAQLSSVSRQAAAANSSGKPLQKPGRRMEVKAPALKSNVI